MAGKTLTKEAGELLDNSKDLLTGMETAYGIISQDFS